MMTRFAIALLLTACVNADHVCTGGDCISEDADDFSVLQTKLAPEKAQHQIHRGANDPPEHDDPDDNLEAPPAHLLQEARIPPPEGMVAPPASLVQEGLHRNDCSSPSAVQSTLSGFGWTFNIRHHSSSLSDAEADELLGELQLSMCPYSKWGDYKAWLSYQCIKYANPNTLSAHTSFVWTRSAPIPTASEPSYSSLKGVPSFDMGVGPDNQYVLANVAFNGYMSDSSLAGSTFHDVILIWRNV